MTGRHVRIELQPRGRWTRWVDWLRTRSGGPETMPTPVNVDLTLVSRVAAEHVRRFIESIEQYELVSRRSVQVISRYRVPDHAGLAEKVPQWLSERIRFGVVEPDGRDFRYASLHTMEMRWDDDGCELLLHFQERITPGTRAFIAAYLGEGGGSKALRELPFTAPLGGSPLGS